MNGRFTKRTCKKAIAAFIFGLWILISSVGDVLSVDEPPAKGSSSAADELAAISKEIQQIFKGLGYSGDTDMDLVQIISRWEYADWKQMLNQARQDYGQKKTSAQQEVQEEEKVLKALCNSIKKEFSLAAGDSEYFYLPKVVNNKTAQYLGYAQLLYMFGNSIGLTVKVVDVLEPAGGQLPVGEEHAACLVELAGGKTIMADLTQDSISMPFVFRDQYGAAGNYWELKQKENPLKIPRRIQILDRSGIVADIYNCLGNSYAKSGKVSDAVSYFSKAIDLNPKLAKAYSSRGAEFLSMGQHAKAIPDLDKAIELDPKSAEAYFNQAMLYAASKQDAKALSNFNKAIELKPIFPAAYKSRGNAYLKAGRNPEALSDFAKAIELNPKDAAAYFLLGHLYVQSGKDDKAITYFTKAIELNAKYAEAYNFRGIEYGKLEKYTDAISDFIRAVEINPKYADAYYYRAVTYDQLEQYDPAIKYYSKALEIEPKFAMAYNGRGVDYNKLGNYIEARADFNKVVQLQPKNARAYLNRAIACLNLKKNEDAKRDLKKAGELDPALKEEIKKISETMK
jgi:tetratricopeptide (TPR) repeat protein